MPAPPVVSTQELVNALITWRGDVSATARALGLARNSLYERIKRLGLDLDAFRRLDSSAPVTPINQVPGVTGNRVPGLERVTGFSVPARAAQKNARAIYPGVLDGRKLSTMQAPSAATDEATEGDLPIRTAPRRQQPLRLRPDLREQIQRGAWLLQAKYQVPTDDNLILEQYVEEGFQAWLSGKLGNATATAANGKKKPGGDR